MGPRQDRYEAVAATSGDTALVRLTAMLRLRRRRGRCDWRRQDWRSTGGLAPWHCATCGQLEVVRATDTFHAEGCLAGQQFAVASDKMG